MGQCSISLQKNNYQDPLIRLVKMHGSTGVGASLVKSGKFAADILFFAEGTSTEMHTHPGDHILFVASGSGFLVFDGHRHDLAQGDCYFVPGSTPHQVGAAQGTLHLLSIANDHRPVDSEERLQIV